MKRVQFGSGSNILPGWDNTDIGQVDLTRAPYPYSDGAVDYVFAEHVIEHLTSHDAYAALREFYRILKPGGKLRICCPVLDRLTKDEAADIILNHGHKIFFSARSLVDFVRAAGFTDIRLVPRGPIDGHHKVIGRQKDDKETARVEAKRP